MSRIYEALQRAEAERAGAAASGSVWRIVPRLFSAASARAAIRASGIPSLPPRPLDAELRGLRAAVEGLDGRFAREMGEREQKLVDALRHAMERFEAQLSRKLTEELRRARRESRAELTRLFAGFVLLASALAGLVVAFVAASG